MKLTIFAATGGIGRQLLEQAVAAGHDVTAVARNPRNLPATQARVVTADLAATDAAALQGAVAGADAVLSALGARTKADTGVAARGTKAITEAMRASGVRRLVVVSAAPIGTVPSPGRPHPPRHDPGDGFVIRYLGDPIIKRVFRAHYADLAQMEDILRGSDLDWTVVRPPRLTGKPVTGRYRTAYGQNIRGGIFASRADVAHYMLRALDQPETYRQTVGIANSAARLREVFSIEEGRSPPAAPGLYNGYTAVDLAADLQNYTFQNYSFVMSEPQSRRSVLVKPDRVFDRDREWTGLASFASNPVSGALLGVVSGRRRQGKSFLLEALTSVTGGLYFPALEETAAVSLRSFSSALIGQGIPVSRPLQDWGDAFALLFGALRGQPRTVVIDEFPFLVKASPSLPSIIQRELGPGGSGQASTARLLLCGSAMSVMGGLLAGQAPLRGRASLELLIRPFEYTDTARFWGAGDARLALLLHAVVGGTPAYRREFVAFDTPAGLADFDDWVIRTVLNPQSPLFREARYLLAEETEIRDPALYHSVLGAIAAGNHTNGGIAGFVGRKSAEITHPLNVLEDCALISREPDLFRPGRSTYRVTEPLITFYEAIMRPDWFRLESGHAEAVWRDQRAGFLSRVVGPHFETLCRSYALRAGSALFGTPPGEIGAGVVNDSARRTQIQIDVAVLAPTEPGRRRRILSLGEAKWGETMGGHHLERLARARDLLSAGYDTSDCVLACYSAAGFHDDLRAANSGHRLALVTLDDIYA